MTRLSQVWVRLRGVREPRRFAFSVAIGLGIGVTPLWGLHWLLISCVCVPLRLDTPVALLASQVSLPWFAPWITALEMAVGSVLTGRRPTWDTALSLDTGIPLAVGTLVLALGLSTVGGLAAYVSARRALGPQSRGV